MRVGVERLRNVGMAKTLADCDDGDACGEEIGSVRLLVLFFGVVTAYLPDFVLYVRDFSMHSVAFSRSRSAGESASASPLRQPVPYRVWKKAWYTGSFCCCRNAENCSGVQTSIFFGASRLRGLSTLRAGLGRSWYFSPWERMALR